MMGDANIPKKKLPKLDIWPKKVCFQPIQHVFLTDVNVIYDYSWANLKFKKNCGIFL